MHLTPASRRADSTVQAPAPSVAVIIPCYNHAHFLSAAIESVQAQTHRNVEIVVIDDGSPDDTREVANRHAGVRYVHQNNRGLSAARNTGIRESRSPYLVFLDADDLLLPNALDAGLACFKEHPESTFVSGGFRYAGTDGAALGEPVVPCIAADHYLEMLKRSYISMHATVMFRREVLELVNGFDESLPACEDFDIYLRVARSHPVCCHPGIVAEYRRHNTNMSNDSALMLRTAMQVLGSQWPYVKSSARYRAAYRAGRRFWSAYYGPELDRRIHRLHAQGHTVEAIRASLTLLRWAPGVARKRLVGAVTGRSRRGVAAAAKRLLPARWVGRLRAVRWTRSGPIPLGCVRFGDLDRLTPVSRQFGFDRGLPIDRYYIEGFLFRCAMDIGGSVLEVADNAYTSRFGGNRVQSSDILDVNAENARATVVADLTNAEHIPADRFDCIIVTQTLHLIYDVRAPLRTLHRILKPGGVLLLTVPGITQVDQQVRENGWYWAFTHDAVRRLLEEIFPPAGLQVEDHGNVFAATAFLHGLAVEELSTGRLDHRDPAYPVIIAARAVKPLHPS